MSENFVPLADALDSVRTYKPFVERVQETVERQVGFEEPDEFFAAPAAAGIGAAPQGVIVPPDEALETGVFFRGVFFKEVGKRDIGLALAIAEVFEGHGGVAMLCANLFYVTYFESFLCLEAIAEVNVFPTVPDKFFVETADVVKEFATKRNAAGVEEKKPAVVRVSDGLHGIGAGETIEGFGGRGTDPSEISHNGYRMGIAG